PVLEQVRSIGLQERQVIVLADRGFVHEQRLALPPSAPPPPSLAADEQHLGPVGRSSRLCSQGVLPSCRKDAVLPSRSRVSNSHWTVPPGGFPVGLSTAMIAFNVASDQLTTARTDAARTVCALRSKPLFSMRNPVASSSSAAS